MAVAGPTGPDMPDGPPTVLVYRALGLGDFLTGVPALRGIRRAFPDHRLVLATDPGLRPLIPLTGAVDDFWPTRALEPLSTWPAAPDVAVNLHGRGPESHQVLTALGPDRLVAFARPDLGVTGPEWRSDEHEVHRWCRLVEQELRTPTPPTDLVLDRPAVQPPVAGAIVVHPGAAAPSRRWPVERFGAVARQLAASGGPVVVTGSSAERELTLAVCAAAGLPEEASLAGSTAVDALAALVATARLVVCNDTGVAHLATAYRTPSVVLFGPVSPALWGPPRFGPHRTLWHGEASVNGEIVGDPHGTSLDPTLARIQVSEVVDVAESLLGSSLSRRPEREAPTTAPFR